MREAGRRATPAHYFIVTGGSRGLGQALVEQLLRPGHTVVSIARGTNDELDALARLRGATLLQLPFDLADAAVIARQINGWLLHEREDTYDSATLINNAGTVGRPGPLALATFADLGQSIRVGLEAPLVLAAAFLSGTGHWKASRKVLNISSGLGRKAIAGQSPYCAAKAGMDHFSRVVALEEAARPNGARIVSLAPGVIDTDMQLVLRQTSPEQLPDQARYARLKMDGQLDSPAAAAKKILAYLERPDFGDKVIADINDV